MVLTSKISVFWCSCTVCGSKHSCKTLFLHYMWLLSWRILFLLFLRGKRLAPCRNAFSAMHGAWTLQNTSAFFKIVYGLHLSESCICCFLSYETHILLFLNCMLLILRGNPHTVTVYILLFLHFTLLTHYDILHLLCWQYMWLTPCNIFLLKFYIAYG